MLHTSRRAVSAAALGGASAVLGFGYASEMPSREEDLPRRWDGAAIEAYWDARPFATLGRACAIARTVAPGRDALVALGPAFIKLGQALSIRPDVVPAAALDELRSLCDAVPAVPTTTALATIEAEVGAMAFGGLDASTPPVAAASLGQVYKVELEGRTVALKVQRPNVIAAVSLDLALLRKWARFVERAKVFLVPKQRPYDEALVEAFSRGAWSELDYEAEAANQEDMAPKLALATSRTLRRNVHIPAVRLRSRKVLATDWVDGDQLCRASKAEIARLVPLGVELFMWQMLDVGTYHCDPHPGNLLVDAQGRLALIDFGLCTEIDVGEREALTKAVVHLIQGAVPALIDDAVALDFLPADVDKEALYPVLSRVFEDARLAARASPDVAAVKKRRKEFAAVSADLNDIFFNYPFRVPDFFALITRALIILEGIAISGDPDFDIFKAAYPHGVRRAEQIFGRQGLAEMSAAAAAAYLAPRRRATVAVDVGEDVVVAASS
ncbi:ABC1 family-like protein [Aureococcus anophagefferens]|nr:ABC1 family-like protein [Aureococcus anophagefferens]